MGSVINLFLTRNILNPKLLLIFYVFLIIAIFPLINMATFFSYPPKGTLLIYLMAFILGHFFYHARSLANISDVNIHPMDGNLSFKVRRHGLLLQRFQSFSTFAKQIHSSAPQYTHLKTRPRERERRERLRTTCYFDVCVCVSLSVSRCTSIQIESLIRQFCDVSTCQSHFI